MADQNTLGYTISQFSQETLDLQEKNFCSGSTDNRKLVRFFKNTPGVYQNANVVFSSPDLDLSPFFQLVDLTRIDSVKILAGATATVQLNAGFLFIKVIWPPSAIESSKIVELGLPAQAGLIGNQIPGSIGIAGTTNYVIIKDMFITNSNVGYTENLLINNATSPYDITVYIMQAI
jgi:hypothetical protein